MPAPRPTFTVDVNDESGSGPGLVSALQASVLRAAAAWTQYLVGYSNLNIELNIVPTAVGTADGSSTSFVPIGHDDDRTVGIGTAPDDLLTGQDPYGNNSQVVIDISPNYISQYLWFDPDPGHDSLPGDKINADEVFEHELGHALGFNGFRDTDTTNLGSFESTFDKYVTFDGSSASFTGPAAEAAYGGPVPLTYSPDDPENFYHYANSNGPGADLISGLMSGVGHYLGTQAYISPLDVAMLSDAGCPIGLPDPGTNGDDSIVAGNLPVVADLYRGNDVFQGGAASDFAFGGAGNDSLFGGGGNDVLAGGPGSNLLMGGAGADTFVVRVAGASDEIADYHPLGGDTIRLVDQSYSFGTAADGSLMLNLSGGGSVVLDGFDPARQGLVKVDMRTV